MDTSFGLQFIHDVLGENENTNREVTLESLPGRKRRKKIAKTSVIRCKSRPTAENKTHVVESGLWPDDNTCEDTVFGLLSNH